MTNYIIDGSINFYEELMKNDEIDENNICLLSNLPLDETHIQLPCSHKFNYIYIFNEVKSSKRNDYFNIGYKYVIKHYEIKCPYCRKIFDRLLPPCKNIPGTKLLKNINKSNYTLNIKCLNEDETCDSIVYVTNYGYYCNNHYRIHKKKYKNAQKKTLPKYKPNNRNEIINGLLIVDAKLFCNQNIDFNEIKLYISKNYKKDIIKNILIKKNIKHSGKKEELINKIIENTLYILK